MYHLSVADRMCRSGAVDLICVDSVSALTPRAEIEVCYKFLPIGLKLFYQSNCGNSPMSECFPVLFLLQGEIGMQQMGLQARLMSQALRKMSGNASKAGCTLIFLNQIRYKVRLIFM